MLFGVISVMLVNKNAVWYFLKPSQVKRRLDDVLVCVSELSSYVHVSQVIGISENDF